MKECINKNTTAGRMDLECLILNPAFIGKQSRQVHRSDRKAAEVRHIEKRFLNSGDVMLMKLAGLAGLVFILSLFC